MCACLCLSHYMLAGVCGGQKGESDPTELELHVVRL